MSRAKEARKAVRSSKRAGKAATSTGKGKGSAKPKGKAKPKGNTKAKGATRNPESEQLGLAIEELKEAEKETKQAEKVADKATKTAEQATKTAEKATRAAEKATKTAEQATKSANKAANAGKGSGKAKPKGKKEGTMAAAKKPAKKPAAKPAAKTAATGKASSGKGKAKAGGSKKPSQSKDLRKVSETKTATTKARWKDMKTGKRYTTEEMRKTTKNPSGGWGAVARIGGGVFIGLVSADVVDRLVATMGTGKAKHAWQGPDGQQRIMQRPGAARLGAQVGIGALFFGGAWAAGTKFPKIGDGLAGVGIGYVLHAGAQGVTHWVMPKIFSLKNGDENSRMGQLYYFDQDGFQKKLDEAIKVQNDTAEAHPGQAEKLPVSYLFAPAAPTPPNGTTQGIGVGNNGQQQQQQQTQERPQGLSAERQALVRARVEAEERNKAAASVYGGAAAAGVAGGQQQQPNTTGCGGAGGCGNKAAGKKPCSNCAGKAGHNHGAAAGAAGNDNSATVGGICQCAGCLEDYNAGKVMRHSPALRNGAVAAPPAKKLEDNFDLPAGPAKELQPPAHAAPPALPPARIQALGDRSGRSMGRMSRTWGNLEGVG